jgi:amino acid transporter
MKLLEWILGRPLRTDEQEKETIGIFSGVAVLGLDAIASSSYGPEAALTALIPAGDKAGIYIIPITAAIVVVLLSVYFSYLQTIAAYTNGGGSYVVARENLGPRWGMLAASALSIDYVLNVAVAISAGVGAIVSAAPQLQPHTVALCMGILLLLTMVNLRGIRTTGLIFSIPAALYIVSMSLVILYGHYKLKIQHGAPPTSVPPAAPAHIASSAVAWWLCLRAFASGCSALTGVEAVSNAVPVFRKPTVKRARATLTVIVAALAFLLCGIASLAHFYHLHATEPGQPGFESIISQAVRNVVGKTWSYYVTVGAAILVLALSANTSFTDFPRVCRLLALDKCLPAEFGRRGSRLVYSFGILTLAALAGALLLVFRGVTDRLIPLFAVGAFMAFTLSQLGMVWHWLKHSPRRTWLATINGIGALATFATTLVLIVSKFREGAWLTAVTIPTATALFYWIGRYHQLIEREIAAYGPIHFEAGQPPLIVIPMKRLDRVTRKALRLALGFAKDIHVVQILDDDPGIADLQKDWERLVKQPVEAIGHAPPTLFTINSSYREFFEPLIDYIKRLATQEPDRCIAVWIPELAERRWYTFLLRHRATRLKRLLLLHGLPQIIIINTPWYAEEVTHNVRAAVTPG